MSNCCSTFLRNLGRRKPLETNSAEETRLKRCLDTFDLTALGVGSTLGLGVYVLAGQVAVTAGPSVVLSFVIAAVASVFAGLCYAEFAARVPKAGSAYVYSYTTVGEFIAFIIGWNLILEYVIGTASVARGFSGYVDTLLNGTIARHELEWLPTNTEGISPHFDLFSFTMTMVLAILLCLGIKESSTFTTIFTGVNLYVVSFVVICGLFKVSWKNWELPPHTNEKGQTDKGGFFPFGFSGMIAGASRCFYGFVGFDAIASTGEEAKNPQRTMPISICLSLVLILACYFGVAAVSTLMCPYYDQVGDAPLAYIFERAGWPVAYYVIAVGAITSLTTALLGSLLPLPRVLFAMASDGLLPDLFQSVNRWTNTPVYGTLFAGLFAGTMAAMFNTGQLTDMMSIGTLLAYTLVSLSVLILRYQEDHLQVGGELPSPQSAYVTSRLDDGLVDNVDSDTYSSSDDFSSSFVLSVLNVGGPSSPSRVSAKIANFLIVIICINIVVFGSIIHFWQDDLFNGDFMVSTWAIASLLSLIIFTQLLHRQPQTRLRLLFKVPCLPYFPILCIFFNFYLMLNLSKPTWIRFGVWMTAGFAIYFGYGYWLSSGYKPEAEKKKEASLKASLIEKVKGETNEPPVTRIIE